MSGVYGGSTVSFSAKRGRGQRWGGVAEEEEEKPLGRQNVENPVRWPWFNPNLHI